MRYYKYNHQIFRYDPETDKHEIYHRNKGTWEYCMLFQITHLRDALKKGRASELSEEKIFTELL